MSQKSRVLSKKDIVSPEEALKIIKNARLTQDESGLFLDKHTLESRKEFCGACGKPFIYLDKEFYFGEYFHKKCVEKMRLGARP